jgi:hypothetical protein
LSTSYGCDSIITISLTIELADTSIIETSCNVYLSPSGNYTWNSSGTYVDTLQSALGCDSIITIDLTIGAVDTNVLQVGNSLSAVFSGASYQWVNCDSAYADVSGETSQSFEPSISGNYAVIVTNDGCADTSNCYEITLSAILENTFERSINLYPNPTKRGLVIEINKMDNITVEVENSLGQILEQKVYNQTKRMGLNLNQPQGLYFVSIRNDNGQKVVRKIVKE